MRAALPGQPGPAARIRPLDTETRSVMRSGLVRTAVPLALTVVLVGVPSTIGASSLGPAAAADAAPVSRQVADQASPLGPAAPLAAPAAGPLQKTKVRYSYKQAIRESVWVEAPDGDGDGKKDLVTADIIRPSELDGNVRSRSSWRPARTTRAAAEATKASARPTTGQAGR
jgi:hypothetical protein